MTIAAESMTTDQLLALPDDGRERWLIHGELREGEMTRRNRGHSKIEATIAYVLKAWSRTQPEPRGEVLVGEAGVRLRRDPDTTVGVDVAYISAATADANPDEERIVDGVPILMVEILSPTDKHEDVREKVSSYLACGVGLVWVVDPSFRTITIYRGDAEPVMYNVTHTLDAGQFLPGFVVAVKDIFAR
jgi:Uma2 family endonuclease